MVSGVQSECEQRNVGGKVAYALSIFASACEEAETATA